MTLNTQMELNYERRVGVTGITDIVAPRNHKAIEVGRYINSKGAAER